MIEKIPTCPRGKIAWDTSEWQIIDKINEIIEHLNRKITLDEQITLDNEELSRNRIIKLTEMYPEVAKDLEKRLKDD